MRTRLLPLVTALAAAILPSPADAAAASPYAVCTSAVSPCLVSCASNSIVTVYTVGDGWGTAGCAGTSATCRAYPTSPCSRTAVVTGGAGYLWCSAEGVGTTPTVALCFASPFIN